MATEQVIEQVAETLEDTAEVTRRIDPRLVKYFLGGVGLGAAVGFFVGYRYNREKIKAEAFRESEAEIESIREHYQNKLTAKENETEKAQLTTLVVEEGYVERDETLVDYSAAGPHETEDRPLPPPVPIVRPPQAGKDKNAGWNFAKELSSRSPNSPHIIHQDEFQGNETEFSQVTYTYYAEDDVLVDESDEVIADRSIITADFARRFGHGTDDVNVLYVRNPVLEMEIEICRNTGSYEVEVLGLDREPPHEPSA